jgi:hypothetical protein
MIITQRSALHRSTVIPDFLLVNASSLHGDGAVC